MARFLSAEWFAEVAAARAERPAVNGEPDLVLEEIVRATPDGDVRYVVVVGGGSAAIERPGPGEGPDPDLTITCDWKTATAVAQGQLSTQRALMQGRLRVRGNLTRLSTKLAEAAGLDPVPPEVRKDTTY
jgi:putative sterol carrier protein